MSRAPVWGTLIPFSGLCGDKACKWYIDVCACVFWSYTDDSMCTCIVGNKPEVGPCGEGWTKRRDATELANLMRMCVRSLKRQYMLLKVLPLVFLGLK